MEVLPNEILEKIIGFMDKEDLLSVRFLNKTWNSYAKSSLRSMDFLLEKDKDVMDLMLLLTHEDTILPFSQFRISLGLSARILQELSIKYGKEIESLKFEETLSQQEHRSRRKLLQIRTSAKVGEIYYMAETHPDYFRNECKLDFPKLRVLELGQMNMDFVSLILNASPNVKQVKLKISRIPSNGKWQDIITVLKSLAARNIEVKLEIQFSTESDDGINLPTCTEIIEIPLKLIELKLVCNIPTFRRNTLDLYLMQESFQELINKHSRKLKVIIIYYYNSGIHSGIQLELDLNQMETLEKLELCTSAQDMTSNIKINLGSTPILKEIRIELAELNFTSIPLLKKLNIKSHSVCEYLNKIGLIEATILQRIEEICLYFSFNSNENDVGALEADSRVLQLNNFLNSQARTLKFVKIETQNSTGFYKLRFPKMENLLNLELNLDGMGSTEKVQLQETHFPSLKLLSLNTPLHLQPNSTECMETVHTLILGSKSYYDFIISGLKFPKLRKLQLIGTVDGSGILQFVFTNMTHVKELDITLGGMWHELIGIGISESEVYSEYRMQSSGNDISPSFPNLGDMIALQTLKFRNSRHLTSLRAVSCLIMSGKLTKLKHFETTFPFGKKRTEFKLQISPLVKIIESNNTKTKINFGIQPQNFEINWV